MEVGFLGLGIMGKAMAVNLQKNGFKVTVWNRTLSKCEELVLHGASIGKTPAEVVKKCKYTIAMLADPPAAQSVVFSKDGVLEQMCSGKGYIDMSTVDAATSSKICKGIIEKGGRFVEAPVSGSKKPAEDGQLIILAAGDKSLHDEVMPAFDVMGKKTFFLGEVGNGAKMKLVVNMIMGSTRIISPKNKWFLREFPIKVVACITRPMPASSTSMANAFSEGLVLTDRSELSQQTLLDVLVGFLTHNFVDNPISYLGAFEHAFKLNAMANSRS